MAVGVLTPFLECTGRDCRWTATATLLDADGVGWIYAVRPYGDGWAGYRWRAADGEPAGVLFCELVATGETKGDAQANCRTHAGGGVG